MMYAKALESIDEIDLQEVMDKAMKVLDPIKGSTMKSQSKNSKKSEDSKESPSITVSLIQPRFPPTPQIF